MVRKRPKKSATLTKNQPVIYAFIDSQNLNLGVRAQGWQLDFARFRVFLREKYNVQKAFLCIGYIPGNEQLYAYLQEAGYICIFKPTMELPDGKVKGNVDAELVLHTMAQQSQYDAAIIVSGDGDFYCLVEYLLEQSKLAYLFVPNRKKYSAFLKHKQIIPFTRFVSDFKRKLQKRSPGTDSTAQG